MGSKSSALLCFLVALAASPEALAQQDSWSANASGPAFSYGASATDGTYFYLIGGLTGGGLPDSYGQLRRYDPAGNSWTTLAAMPAPYRMSAGACYGGRLFSFGGEYFYQDNNGEWVVSYSNQILAYTIASNSWTTLSATLTSNRSACAAATSPTPLGVRIYVTGGFINGGSNGYSSATDEFNPANDTLVARAAMPGALVHHVMAAIPETERVYALTGINGGSAVTGVCYEYTPPGLIGSGGSWTTRSPLTSAPGSPLPRYQAAAFALNRRLYVTGGYASGSSPDTWEYHPNTDTWTQRASMALSRYNHGAGGPINGKGYVQGPDIGNCEVYTPPDFGSDPYPATAVGQAGSRPETAAQSKANAAPLDGWTNSQITFSATVSDPDAGQQVRFRVQIKRTTDVNWVTLSSDYTAQGTISIPYTIPAEGSYDWRWRVEDSYGNSYPDGLALLPSSWVDAFGNSNSPDFRSDQQPPSDPVAHSPNNVDLMADEAGGGNIYLTWIKSTDDGPLSGLSYEIQIARDSGFGNIEATLLAGAGDQALLVFLPVSD